MFSRWLLLFVGFCLLQCCNVVVADAYFFRWSERRGKRGEDIGRKEIGGRGERREEVREREKKRRWKRGERREEERRGEERKRK